MCDEAKKLRTAYPNAKLSVLGIGMSEQPAANFSCAAKAMGGEFTAVKLATDLDKLLRQAFGVSLDGKPAKHSTAVAPPPEPDEGAGKKQAAAPEPAMPQGAGAKQAAAAGTGGARRTGRACHTAHSRRDQARRAASASG